nr:MAG TPA: minor capsid protein [Microviridae sp.]
MLSDIIIRSTAAFGGTPFRFNKCTALGSAAGGAAAGAAAGGVPGALVGGALGIASSLIGGLFGKHDNKKTNDTNYKIMQEQNKFNAAEAEKLRDWQEMMYRMYGTSSAKANDMRAAGLNALLGDVSSSGNVGSGAAATAAESAQMMPTDYSFVGDAVNRGLAAYNTTRSVDASVSLQKSQENVNKSIEGVNNAQEGFLTAQTDMQKMTYKFAMDTYQNRLLQEQFKAELANWQGFDAMYDARLKAFSLYNIMPQEVEKNVAQTMSFYASAFRDIADGKYTLKQTENYGRWLSIQQTFAHAATVQSSAALMQGRAALTNASANASYLGKLGKYYGSLTSGQNMTNEMSRYYTDFMLGKMPISKAESILRQTPYKHLLDLNIQQNEWSLNKLMQEPDLIRSLSGMYKSETSLTNKRVDSYDTDKIFERGESVSRMVKNISDGISNFTPKPKPRFNKGSSAGSEPTPPPSGKSWLDAYRENPNYSPTGYR